jgi:hypothetical protein
MSAYINKVGKRYGRLVIVEALERLPYPKVERLRCICDCGTEIIKTANQLHGAKSCGCLNREARVKNASKKKPKSQSQVNLAYHWHKCNAAARDLTPLSRPDWEAVVSAPCRYCGGMDTYTLKSHHSLNQDFEATVRINGVDRLSSQEDYSKVNSVPCCTVCNRMKNDRTEKDFLNHVKQIVSHLKLCP